MNFECFYGRNVTHMDNRKIILAFYLLAGMVGWFLLRSTLNYFYLAFYQFRRFPQINSLREIVPVAVGAAIFLVLTRHTKANLVMDETVVELKKVTWPTRPEVVRSTTVVIICIFIASGILAVFDLMWGKIIGLLLKI